MILGIGVDLVNLDRFADLIERNPALLDRLLTLQEQAQPLRSQAARFAAKEAAAKALGAPAGLNWKDCQVVNNDQGAPYLQIKGTVAARAAALGVNRLHLTISHDEPFAQATVIAEHLSDQDLSALKGLDPAPLGLLTDLPAASSQEIQ